MYYYYYHVKTRSYNNTRLWYINICHSESKCQIRQLLRLTKIL